MKATEIKYLFLLHSLARGAARTQSALAEASDIPLGLVNRYVRRLRGWRLIGGAGGSMTVTDKGRAFIADASWKLADYVAGILNDLQAGAVGRLRSEACASGWKRAVIYGDTALTAMISAAARGAGIEVVAICDEERSRDGVVQLADLSGRKFDCFILADWERRDDRVLAALLRHYAPVVNLFASDAGRPDGVEHAFKLDA